MSTSTKRASTAARAGQPPEFRGDRCESFAHRSDGTFANRSASAFTSAPVASAKVQRLGCQVGCQMGVRRERVRPSPSSRNSPAFLQSRWITRPARVPGTAVCAAARRPPSA
jgi:hypothetical protein